MEDARGTRPRKREELAHGEMGAEQGGSSSRGSVTGTGGRGSGGQQKRAGASVSAGTQELSPSPEHGVRSGNPTASRGQEPRPDVENLGAGFLRKYIPRSG